MKKRKGLIVLGLLMLMFIPMVANASALSSLKVRGIEEELSTKNNWNLSYVSPRDSMVVEATPSDSSYTIEGIGRITLQNGKNTHTVVVKDASGNEIEKYTLNVNFSHNSSSLTTSTSPSSGSSESDGKVPNPNTGYFIHLLPIIIGLFILIILTINKKKMYKI